MSARGAEHPRRTRIPADEIARVASSRSTGLDAEYGETGRAQVKNIDHFDFAGWDMAIFAAGLERSKNMRPIAAPPAAR
jgi:aspartate-semialdehyde dehydrogenase